MNSDQIQEIKDRLDIADLIGQYVPLQKSGISFKANCPFHKEKTPSFIVTPSKQIFKCFGCGEGGDIFSFIEKMEGLSFSEALRLLADRTGVTLANLKDFSEYKIEQDVKTDLFLLNAAATKLFNWILIKHSSAQKARYYLKKRGINQQSIDRFQIGYAPLTPVLLQWCNKNHISSSLLAKAGNPDRFRNRIIFPLKNPLGNVVGFTARALDDRQQPKYLNTPETLIFQKGKLVYGLFEDKQSIKKEGAVILLEGQMDVIMASQTSKNIAVASSGTALTSDHLKIIARYVPRIYFSFDQDEAGFVATKKALRMILETDLSALIIDLPAGFKDAAELIVKDPKRWTKAFDRAKPILDWLIDKELSRAGKLDATAKKTIVREIMPFIAQMKDPIEQAHYLAILAKTVEVTEKILADITTRFQHRISANEQSPAHTNTRCSLEEQLLGIILLNPNLIEQIEVPEKIFSGNDLFGQIDKSFRDCYFNQQLTSSEMINTNIKKGLDQAARTALELLLAEAEQLLTGEAEPQQIARELIARIIREHKEETKKKIALEIAQAENQGDRIRVKKLIEELSTILR